MARRKPARDDGPALFEVQERDARTSLRRQRALIIPRLLENATRTGLQFDVEIVRKFETMPQGQPGSAFR